MDIDFVTGKVSYPERDAERAALIKSLEEMKLREEKKDPLFIKTIHLNLKYSRLKYLWYCFLTMVDGFIGIISFGETQSNIASKYLRSDNISGDDDGDRQDGSQL